MKKMSNPNDKNLNDEEMLAEYKFDYAKAKPNRFAHQSQQAVIILDPDVAEHFKNSEAVNKVLRALIRTMPEAV